MKLASEEVSQDALHTRTNKVVPHDHIWTSPFATAAKRSVCKTQITGFPESIKTLKTASEIRTLNLSKLLLNFSTHCAEQLIFITVSNSDCRRHLSIMILQQ